MYFIIYKLNVGEYVYFGSSVKSLKEVYIMLKSHSTAKKTRDSKLYSIINQYGIENIKLSIYKEVSGNIDRKELNRICWDVVYSHKDDKGLLNTKYLITNPQRVEC